MSIQSVDMSDFLSGDTEKKKGFVQKLGKAYEDIGFVADKNHGITDELITNLYKYVQQLFSLPLEQKKKYEIKGLAEQPGYTCFDIEHAKGSESPNLKLY